MLVNGFICEGPRCTKGPNGSRSSVSWNADEAKVNPEYQLPDEFHRYIISQPTYEEPSPYRQSGQPVGKTFCSASCLRDFYHENHYTAPRSPREQAAQAEANARVEAGEKPQVLAKSKVIPFNKPSTPATRDGFGKPIDSQGEQGDGSNIPA